MKNENIVKKSFTLMKEKGIRKFFKKLSLFIKRKAQNNIKNLLLFIFPKNFLLSATKKSTMFSSNAINDILDFSFNRFIFLESFFIPIFQRKIGRIVNKVCEKDAPCGNRTRITSFFQRKIAGCWICKNPLEVFTWEAYILPLN